MHPRIYHFHLHSFGTFDANHPIGPSCWPYFDLFSLHQGKVTLRLQDSDPFEMAGGECVLIYPNTPFSGKSLTSESVASVQHFALVSAKPTILPEVLSDLPERTHGFEGFQNSYPAFLEDATRAIELAETDTDGSLQPVREALHSFILLSLRLGPATSFLGQRNLHAAVSKVAEWASTQSDSHLTVEDLARKAGLSPSRFRDLFKQEFGASPRQFLQVLRLNEGKRLLRETRLSIKEIAIRSGYGDLVAFSRAFRNTYHTTPARYRKETAPSG